LHLRLVAFLLRRFRTDLRAETFDASRVRAHLRGISSDLLTEDFETLSFLNFRSRLDRPDLRFEDLNVRQRNSR
jgi:hypothetical protein